MTTISDSTRIASIQLKEQASAPATPAAGYGQLYVGTDKALKHVDSTGAEVTHSPPLTAAEVTFTETTGAGVYTGSVTVPAGATIHDIKVFSPVLWNTQTSATMTVGDGASANGWFTGIDLKATDLLVGEELNFVQTGGKQGAYLDTTAGLRSAAYSASARVVAGIVTTVGTTGSAGRTRMIVVWSLLNATAATKA